MLSLEAFRTKPSIKLGKFAANEIRYMIKWQTPRERQEDFSHRKARSSPQLVSLYTPQVTVSVEIPWHRKAMLPLPI